MPWVSYLRLIEVCLPLTGRHTNCLRNFPWNECSWVNVFILLLSVSLINTLNKSSVGRKELNWLVLQIHNQSLKEIRVTAQDRNLEGRMINWFPLSCVFGLLANFLTEPRHTFLGMASPKVGWDVLHQSSVKKISPSHGHRSVWFGQCLHETLSNDFWLYPFYFWS